MIRSLIRRRDKRFFLFQMLRMALGLTQFFGLLPQWSSDWGVKPTTHFRIVTSFGMGEAIPLLPLYSLLA
jgi:hypothetical protein